MCVRMWSTVSLLLCSFGRLCSSPHPEDVFSLSEMTLLFSFGFRSNMCSPQRRWKIPTVGSRGDTDTSQEPEYGPSDPRDQILPGQTLCSQRPCEARQGLGPQGKASSSSRWPFLVLSQESQLQALGPAVQGSLPEGRPLLLSGIHYPFLFVWDSQNLTRCSQSTFP